MKIYQSPLVESIELDAEQSFLVESGNTEYFTEDPNDYSDVW